MYKLSMDPQAPNEMYKPIYEDENRLTSYTWHVTFVRFGDCRVGDSRCLVILATEKGEVSLNLRWAVLVVGNEIDLRTTEER